MTSLALNSDQTGVISVDADGMMVMSDIFGPNKNREEFKLEIRCKYVKHQLSYPVALTEDAELSDLSLLAKPNCPPGQGPIKKFVVNDYTLVPKAYYQDLLREIEELQERMDNLKHDTEYEEVEEFF